MDGIVAWLLSPPLLFMIGALIAAFSPSWLRRSLLLLVPVLAFLSLLGFGSGEHIGMRAIGFQLQWLRIDSLSLPFAVIFCLAALLAGLYAWHVNDRLQQLSTLVYAGAALGAVLAGELITLFLWWEVTAVASAALVFARRTPAAFATAQRYLMIQVLSGVLLLLGLLLHYHESGSIAFEHLGLVSSGTLLILLAFGIKCAFPLMHNWLQDAYPAATVTGTVVLSIFTTKMAVYTLARGYAGTEILMYVGLVMALFPLFFAEIENDMRRLLAYTLNNQLGFMVVGIGIGTEMALNGTVANAFAGVLYKGLLFMSIGAVLYRTGTARASELGGLHHSMPKTMMLCLVGAASIAGVPLLAGFVSKSLIFDAAAHEQHALVWFGLMFASVGVLSHAAIRLPYFTFFGADSGKRPAEAPTHMLIAMGITAALCVAIGVFPGALLYPLMPFAVEYEPYTAAHVVQQLQLVFFATLAIVIVARLGFYPLPERGINLDSDVLYRKVLPSVTRSLGSAIGTFDRVLRDSAKAVIADFGDALLRLSRRGGVLSASWGIAGVGGMMGAIMVYMFLVLLFNLL